jgi:2-deoxy-D-gluconate 3-dehydrogenase
MGVDLGALDVAAARETIGKVIADHGRLDVLINNAGIIRRAPTIDHPEADWAAVMHTNVSSPFFLTQAAARWWISEGRANADAAARLKVVFVASLLSFQGGITVPAYAASKHAIAGLTKALSNEWARERINVNSVAPGYIETDNTAAIRADPARSKSILERIPEGRWGSPEDIAGTVAFLASPAADYVNGAILNVDGGWLGR